MSVDAAELDRFSSLRPRVGADVALAIAMAVAQAVLVLASDGLGIAERVTAVICTVGFAALVWRRRQPLAVLVLTLAAVFAQELTAPHVQSPVLFLTIGVASYSLGAHARTASLVAGVLLGVPGVVMGHALGPPVHEFSDVSADAFFFAVLVLVPAGVGRVVRARAVLAARLEAAGDRLSAVREQRVTGTVARERNRIVTELERLMLGSLDAMAAHAEAASLEQIRALERAARDTLVGMRGLLADLRSGPQARLPSCPLAELHERVAFALAAETDLDALPAGQDSLTPASEDASLRRRSGVLSSRRVDFALAVVAGLLSCAAVVTTLASSSHHGPGVIDALLAAAALAPIGWARRATWPATAVAVVALIAYVGLAMPSDPLSGLTPTGLLLCFPFALGARRGIRGASAGLLVCLTGASLLAAVDPRASADTYSGLAATAAVMVGVWAAGQVLAARSRLLSSLADTAIAIDREQQALAHDRLVEERHRVARELHDAFAHSMTVIVLQAGAARRVWNTHLDLAHEHAAVLRETVRDVLGELRELILAFAQEPEHAPAALRIEGLVQRARTFGIEVELVVSGEPAAVGAAIERAACRIVQEALTNAARHAPGALVRVAIDRRDSALSIVVENGPPVRRPEAENGSGHGLQGMRERTTECGGALRAQPVSDGGFQVAASLPLSAP